MRESRYCPRIFFVVFLILSAQTLSAAQVVFMDGTFSDADWTSSLVSSTGGAPSFLVAQSGTGGNPGAHRTVRHTFGGNGNIVVGHLRNGAVYDPSNAGEITSIDASFDLVLRDGGDSNTVAYGIFLVQNGNVYLGADALTSIEPVIDVWQNRARPNLVASSFRPFAGASGLPDFTTAGGPLAFGFFTSNGTAGATPTTTLSGIDNWIVTLNTAPVVVPVPGALALVLLPALFALFPRRASRVGCR